VCYPSRQNQPVRVRTFIDFLVEHFRTPLAVPAERGAKW
jgi:hypothetical protein